MRYLLDTSVVSELLKATPDNGVLEWVGKCGEESLFLSVLTLGELERAVARLPESVEREHIRDWIDTELCTRFRGRLLSVDVATAVLWGWLVSECSKRGGVLSVLEGLLAATALLHNMTFVARDVSFDIPTLSVFNPWQGVAAPAKSSSVALGASGVTGDGIEGRSAQPEQGACVINGGVHAGACVRKV